MAPTPTKQQLTTTLDTMSSPNLQAKSIASRQSQQSSMHVVHVGKDAQPITLPTMASVNCPSWRKSTNFESLKSSVYSLLGTHSVADLISLTSDELPQDTSAAFQEAQSSAKTIIDTMLDVSNLEPLAFLTSSGKIAHVDDVDSLADRPTDISFIRLRCVLDGSKLD